MATTAQSQASTIPAVSSITPAKPRPLRQQHHAAMMQAAKDALELGVRNDVNIHIFGAAHKSKVPRKNTHGSKDAVGKFDKNGKDQTKTVLAPWTGKYLAANPCIRLDYSGLVAIDVDHGFEGLTDEEMVGKGELNGLPRTYTVRTGRLNGGATFFYIGKRTLPDCHGNNGFKVGKLSGDIKHHGHVAAAGSLHKNGNFYRCINDAPFAPLPDFWRDYKNTKKVKPALTRFQTDLLRKEDAILDADTSPLGLARKRAHEYEARLRERLLAGEVVKVKHGELIPRGRRLKYLTQQAGMLRKQGLDPEGIRILLDLRAVRKCWDGLNFILSHKVNLDNLAKWSADWQEGDYIMTTFIGEDSEVLARERRRLTRHQLLVRAIKQFPDRITASDAYYRLEKALDGTRFTLNRNSGKHQQKTAEARNEAGFAVNNSRGVCTWVRIVPSTIA
jgi:Bifunctional DNA primase/polymerase, N-terminal